MLSALCLDSGVCALLVSPSSAPSCPLPRLPVRHRYGLCLHPLQLCTFPSRASGFPLLTPIFPRLLPRLLFLLLLLSVAFRCERRHFRTPSCTGVFLILPGAEKVTLSDCHWGCILCRSFPSCCRQTGPPRTLPPALCPQPWSAQAPASLASPRPARLRRHFLSSWALVCPHCVSGTSSSSSSFGSQEVARSLLHSLQPVLLLLLL